MPFSYPGELILNICTQVFYCIINHKICRVQYNDNPFLHFTFVRNVMSVPSSIFLKPLFCVQMLGVGTIWQLNVCLMIQGSIPIGDKRFFSLLQPV